MDDLSFSRKPEGEAIYKLVSYQESFWVGVEEVVAISEPLVKVLRLVDGDKPTMGYLYEAMDIGHVIAQSVLAQIPRQVDARLA